MRNAEENLPAGKMANNRDSTVLSIDYHPPYAWCKLLGCILAPRAIEGVEEVRDGNYRRVVFLNSDGEIHNGWVSVSCDDGVSVLRAEISPSLQTNANPETRASGERFFKENEKVKLLGLKAPVVKKTGKNGT